MHSPLFLVEPGVYLAFFVCIGQKTQHADTHEKNHSRMSFLSYQQTVDDLLAMLDNKRNDSAPCSAISDCVSTDFCKMVNDMVMSTCLRKNNGKVFVRFEDFWMNKSAVLELMGFLTELWECDGEVREPVDERNGSMVIVLPAGLAVPLEEGEGYGLYHVVLVMKGRKVEFGDEGTKEIFDDFVLNVANANEG